MNISDKLSLRWNSFPEVDLVVKEILNLEEVPSLESCRKNQIYFLIKKDGNKETVYLIRHKKKSEYTLNGKADKISEQELQFIGAYPKKKSAL